MTRFSQIDPQASTSWGVTDYERTDRCAPANRMAEVEGPGQRRTASAARRKPEIASGMPGGSGLADGGPTEYPVPVDATEGSPPDQIVKGPDGNLWFTTDSDYIGEVTPSGTMTIYSIPYGKGISSHTAIAITNGPDGALWFTDGKNIGRITTSGQISEFPNTSHYTR